MSSSNGHCKTQPRLHVIIVCHCVTVFITPTRGQKNFNKEDDNLFLFLSNFPSFPKTRLSCRLYSSRTTIKIINCDIRCSVRGDLNYSYQHSKAVRFHFVLRISFGTRLFFDYNGAKYFTNCYIY